MINKAEILYSEGNYSGAVEKIWDVFERIKTYYAPSLKKNKSVERVIDDISKGNTDIQQMFENEFRSLIDIGNSYCIRYHEVGKITVSNGIHFEYFYKRCFAVISVVLKELQ
ncbi:hypothetical protein [uncultured Granulicatella sp.]|uniref:hypothetical protein n=1 Tax=uncultured Granulicatella sp. TaxID=316089 RepID=UPI0028D7E497|nr:hypothetical protein [uncultured Granulicatella sp.]